MEADGKYLDRHKREGLPGEPRWHPRGWEWKVPTGVPSAWQVARLWVSFPHFYLALVFC